FAGKKKGSSQFWEKNWEGITTYNILSSLFRRYGHFYHGDPKLRHPYCQRRVVLVAYQVPNSHKSCLVLEHDEPFLFYFQHLSACCPCNRKVGTIRSGL